VSDRHNNQQIQHYRSAGCPVAISVRRSRMD
jgi:hypothetical protein